MKNSGDIKFLYCCTVLKKPDAYFVGCRCVAFKGAFYGRGDICINFMAHLTADPSLHVREAAIW